MVEKLMSGVFSPDDGEFGNGIAIERSGECTSELRSEMINPCRNNEGLKTRREI